MNEKPIWLWIYFGISLFLGLLGIIFFIIGINGVGIIIGGPLLILSIILASVSYYAYVSKKNNNKLIANIILGILLTITAFSFVYIIIQNIVTNDWRNIEIIPIILFILLALFTILTVMLNKKDE